MMKRNIFSIVVLFAVLWANAATPVTPDDTYEGNISIKLVRLEQKGDYLHVDMDVIMEDVKIKSPNGVDLIPQLISPSQALTLPMISVKGLDNYKVYKRKLALMGKKEKTAYKEPYIIEKASKKKSDVIKYRYMLPYQAWMADAHLDVQYDVCGCGDVALMDIQRITDKVILERLLVPYEVTPHLAYIQPEVEEIKRREKQMECFLDFEVNKINIRPEYMNNPTELSKIRAMIDDLRNDENITVNRLDIIGYASPEGSLAGNRRLSEGRAKALRDYLASQYNFPLHLYNISFGGENWKGLEEALASMNMEYKDEALAILRNTVDPDRRKEQLKQLRGGAPYHYLLTNIYPKLRVAICKVGYNVRNFDVSEAKEIIKKRPQNLSLNEMFLVANTYPKGSQEFIDIFETAVRMYPEDETANLNAAAAALLRNDLTSAERYLNRIVSKQNLPEYNNAKGVYFMLNGDYEQAEKYLRTAAQTGLNVAKLNLEELDKKKTNQAELEAKKINKEYIDKIESDN